MFAARVAELKYRKEFLIFYLYKHVYTFTLDWEICTDKLTYGLVALR